MFVGAQNRKSIHRVLPEGMPLRNISLRRLLFAGLGGFALLGEIGLRDPAGLDAGLHNQQFAFLARKLEAIEKSRIASGFAILALRPARQVVGGA